MITYTSKQQQQDISIYNRYTKKKINLHLVYEAFFWLYIYYSLFSVRLGINIPYVGIVWLFIIAGGAIIAFKHSKAFRFPLLMIFTTAISFLAIQKVFFNIPIMDSYLRPFISWPLLAIAFSVLFTQKDFLKRLLLMMFIAIIIMWPTFIYKGNSINDVVQARLQGSGIDNSNDLAAWIGFCALGFWLWVIQTKSIVFRWVFFSCAIVAFAIMGQTVSRGSLGIFLVGVLVSFRSIPLKRWLRFILIITVLTIIIIQIPIVKQNITFYQERLNQETGRFLVWPIIINMIVKQPLVGYGVKNVSQFVYTLRQDITPHNGILFLLMASGLIPFITFSALWISSFRIGLRKVTLNGCIDPLPLILYAFLQMLTSNLYFMAIWCIASIFYIFSINGLKSAQSIPKSI